MILRLIKEILSNLCQALPNKQSDLTLPYFGIGRIKQGGLILFTSIPLPFLVGFYLSIYFKFKAVSLFIVVIASICITAILSWRLNSVSRNKAHLLALMITAFFFFVFLTYFIITYKFENQLTGWVGTVVSLALFCLFCLFNTADCKERIYSLMMPVLVTGVFISQALLAPLLIPAFSYTILGIVLLISLGPFVLIIAGWPGYVGNKKGQSLKVKPLLKEKYIHYRLTDSIAANPPKLTYVFIYQDQLYHPLTLTRIGRRNYEKEVVRSL